LTVGGTASRDAPLTSAAAASETSSVAPLLPTEYDELAHYLSNSEDDVLPASVWRERMDLWWENNPFFQAQDARGWIVRTKGDAGTIVGFFGLIPMPFQLAGREIIAYAATTWRIDPAHRHNTLAAIAKLLRHTRQTLLFTSTTNPVLTKILSALKFVPLRQTDFEQRQPSVLPLRLNGLARFMPGAQRLSEIALKAPSALMSLLPRFGRARLARAGHGLEVRNLDHTDAQFDGLWARTRSFSPTTNVRSAAYINWQCFASRVRAKKLIGCYRGDVLVGYAVIMSQPMKGGRLLGWQCVDLWTDPVVPDATDALVAAMIDRALKEEVDLLELPNHGSAIRTAAYRGGFLPRKPRDLGEMVLGPPPAVAALAGPEAYLCSLQGDTGL
jgi:hypothetical protein